MREYSVQNTDMSTVIDSGVLKSSILAFDKSNDFIANLPASAVTTIFQDNNIDNRIKKKIWVKEEDDIIMKWTKKNGPKKWRKVGSLIPGRNAKQCRERWHNHLDPNISHREWTEQEEWILFLCHEIHGPKWATILSYLSGRTDNSIKNRWNSHLKKNIHALNRRLKDLKTSITNSTNKQVELFTDQNRKMELSLLNKLIEKDNNMFKSIIEYTKDTESTHHTKNIASEIFKTINANIKSGTKNSDKKSLDLTNTNIKTEPQEEKIVYNDFNPKSMFNNTNNKNSNIESDITTTNPSKFSNKKSNDKTVQYENLLINNTNVINQTRNFSFGLNRNG